MNLTAAKAYVALAGAIATALLGVFTADTTVGQILTVVSVIATAVATYAVPNEPGKNVSQRGEAYVGLIVGVLLVVILVVVLLRLL